VKYLAYHFINILDDFKTVALATPLIQTNVKRKSCNAEMRASVASFILQRQSACTSIKVNVMYSLEKNTN